MRYPPLLFLGFCVFLLGPSLLVAQAPDLTWVNVVNISERTIDAYAENLIRVSDIPTLSISNLEQFETVNRLVDLKIYDSETEEILFTEQFQPNPNRPMYLIWTGKKVITLGANGSNGLGSGGNIINRGPKGILRYRGSLGKDSTLVLNAESTATLNEEGPFISLELGGRTWTGPVGIPIFFVEKEGVIAAYAPKVGTIDRTIPLIPLAPGHSSDFEPRLRLENFAPRADKSLTIRTNGQVVGGGPVAALNVGAAPVVARGRNVVTIVDEGTGQVVHRDTILSRMGSIYTYSVLDSTAGSIVVRFTQYQHIEEFYTSRFHYSMSHAGVTSFLAPLVGEDVDLLFGQEWGLSKEQSLPKNPSMTFGVRAGSLFADLIVSDQGLRRRFKKEVVDSAWFGYVFYRDGAGEVDLGYWNPMDTNAQGLVDVTIVPLEEILGNARILHAAFGEPSLTWSVDGKAYDTTYPVRFHWTSEAVPVGSSSRVLINRVGSTSPLFDGTVSSIMNQLLDIYVADRYPSQGGPSTRAVVEVMSHPYLPVIETSYLRVLNLSDLESVEAHFSSPKGESIGTESVGWGEAAPYVVSPTSSPRISLVDSRQGDTLLSGVASFHQSGRGTLVVVGSRDAGTLELLQVFDQAVYYQDRLGHIAGLSSVAEHLHLSVSAEIHPNPATDVVSMTIVADTPLEISLGIFGADGRRVEDLVPMRIEPGETVIPLSMDGLPSGFYQVLLHDEDGALVGRCSLIKN